jgi:hypothetical protein
MEKKIFEIWNTFKLPVTLFGVLIMMKVFGLITLSWGWVLAPLWLSAVAFVAILLLKGGKNE